MEYRMYGLVIRHLSPINKGVQFSHCCVEYANKFHDNEDFKKFVDVDKTMILLDGGTSRDMSDIEILLKNAEINYCSFQEPDLNNLTTAICFLADERTWDFTD